MGGLNDFFGRCRLMIHLSSYCTSRADYCLQFIGYVGIYLLVFVGAVAAIRLISLSCQ